MHALDSADKRFKRDLGNGLVLRWSTERDAEEIIYLTSTVFRWGVASSANIYLANLMQEIMHGMFPGTGADDIALVEDTRRHEHHLVAATCLWRQSWSYGGLPFTIGRPEIVATDAEYRNRGLVRALFTLIHARSEAEGHMVQAITGIPYFYRQFGYEYALDLDVNRNVPLALMPPVVEGEPVPYTFRDATVEDMPLLRTWYERQLAIYPVSTPFDEQWWQYQVQTMPTTQADGHWRIIVIVDTQGKPCGYVTTNNVRWRTSFPVLDLSTAAGVNLQTLLPVLLRELVTRGATMLLANDAQALKFITFAVGRKHPVYAVMGKALAIEQGLPYAWYVRVPNLPAFLRYIAPVLEQRLASSALVGYSGALKFNFYRGGLHVAIEQGKITTIEDWQSPNWDSPENAGFPPLVFLQLLFGHRSLDELRFAFSDVWANEEVVPLLNTLFPASPSWVLPQG